MLNSIDSSLFSQIPEVTSISGVGRNGGALYIHRLDQVFPLASGNKAFKLIGHYLAAQRSSKSHLLSFGGAWSNHLHALALLASKAGWRSTAIVRGLYVDLENPMLRDAQNLGMCLHRVSKAEYAQRRERSYLSQLQAQYPDAWIVPEGGDDALGRWGMRYLAESLKLSVPAGETLLVAAGTGATIRGLAQHLGSHVKLTTALVVKDDQLAERLRLHCRVHQPSFRLIDASGKGYGRMTAETMESIEHLYQQSGILLDPLYNGKAYAAAVDLAQSGESVHLLHTGGVQGWRGLLSRGMLAPYPEIERAAKNLLFNA